MNDMFCTTEAVRAVDNARLFYALVNSVLRYLTEHKSLSEYWKQELLIGN